MAWYLIAGIFVVGLWGVMTRTNMIRRVIALSILNSAVIMLFVHLASLAGDTAPILKETTGTPVDPLPHALMLTAIVVGICVVALALVLVYRLYRRYGTLDMREVERLVWGDAADGASGRD